MSVWRDSNCGMREVNMAFYEHLYVLLSMRF